MAKLAVESRMGSLSSYIYPATPSYDATKLGLGPLLRQYNGGSAEGKFAGPIPIGIGRPIETTAAIPGVFPWALNWSTTYDWVFLADNAGTAATRRIQMFTFNKATGLFSWQGFVTVSFPFLNTQGTYLIRGMRMSYYTYTTGTASAASTAVTGSSTTWSTDRLAVGSRIGFGSTDPTAITTWYEISAIGGDTSITLTTDPGTVTNGPYVIEDLRCHLALTCTTLPNGGLFTVKGLRFENFSNVGTAIGAAVSTDNVRACYWLGDLAASLNQVSFGMGIQDKTDWQTQYVWVADTLANPILYKYNLRKNLTLSAGKDTTAFVLKTGSGGAVTGTVSQANNGRLVQASHGPGSGALCFYFTTTTRVYRSVDVTGITSLSTTWLSGGDVMTEVPPGGTSTFAATGTMNSLEYATLIDKFVILNTAATDQRSYVTRYFSDNSQLDRIFLTDGKQYNQSNADSSITPFPNTLITTYSGWSEGGTLYLAGIGTTAITNLLYAVPIGADWEYASSSNNRMVLPKMSTPNCNNYARVYINSVQEIGGGTSKNLGQPSEGYRMYYRTSGIDDNSGSWTLLDDTGDLSSVAGANYIQIMIEFKTIGMTCIPSRILSVGVTYEDLSTDSHYQPSVAQSDITAKRFAWRFSTAFGTSVPRLRIRLYDAVNGGAAWIDDDSTSQALGSWQKSIDGGTSWVAWTNDDKGSSTITYLRFTPTSLGDNIKVRALLTLY